MAATGSESESRLGRKFFRILTEPAQNEGYVGQSSRLWRRPDMFPSGTDPGEIFTKEVSLYEEVS